MKSTLTCLLASLTLTSSAALAADNVKTDVNIQICTAETYYKARFERPLYSTCTFRFDNVTRVADFDLSAYHRAICNWANGNGATTPQEVIAEWNKEFNPSMDNMFKEVSAPGRTESYTNWYKTHPENDNDMFPYDSPYLANKLIYSSYFPQAHVIEMQAEYAYYNGGGMGASYAISNPVFYFDFDLDRQLTLADLITGDYRTLLRTKVREWLTDNSDNLCLMKDPSTVDLSDQWAIRNGCIVFTYPKYEIACGAAGNVQVPIDSYDLRPRLTPKAQSLLQTNP